MICADQRRVIAGSSAGSIVSALIATRTDVELKDLFNRVEQVGMPSTRDSTQPGSRRVEWKCIWQCVDSLP